MKKLLITALLVLLVSTPCLAKDDFFILSYGDNTVSLGHSITENLGVELSYAGGKYSDIETHSWLSDKPNDGSKYYKVRDTERDGEAIGIDLTYYTKFGVYLGVGLYERNIYWQVARNIGTRNDPVWDYYRDESKEKLYPWSVGYRFSGDDNMTVTLGYHELRGYTVGLHVKH